MAQARVAFCCEGRRSDLVGLARAVAAAMSGSEEIGDTHVYRPELDISHLFVLQRP